jgi:hypothetical protein
MPRKFLRTALGALILAAACNPAGEVSPPPTTTTTTTVPLTADQAAVEFNSCLSEQGLVVPDIPVDDHGRPDLSELADVPGQNPALWSAALSNCAAVIVANGALDLSSEPELAEAVRTRLAAFSACMRTQGVEAFPDPPEDFDGKSVPFPPEAIPVGDPELAAAAEACALSMDAEPSG